MSRTVSILATLPHPLAMATSPLELPLAAFSVTPTKSASILGKYRQSRSQLLGFELLTSAIDSCNELGTVGTVLQSELDFQQCRLPDRLVTMASQQPLRLLSLGMRYFSVWPLCAVDLQADSCRRWRDKGLL